MFDLLLSCPSKVLNTCLTHHINSFFCSLQLYIKCLTLCLGQAAGIEELNPACQGSRQRPAHRPPQRESISITVITIAIIAIIATIAIIAIIAMIITSSSSLRAPGPLVPTRQQSPAARFPTCTWRRSMYFK